MCTHFWGMISDIDIPRLFFFNNILKKLFFLAAGRERIL
jgi:hypothetical protein